MKRFLISLLYIILCMSFNTIQVQDIFFLNKVGSESEYVGKDAKGDIASFQKIIVTKIDKKDAKNFTITFTTEIFDKNKKTVAPATTHTSKVIDGKIQHDVVAAMGEALANAEYTGTYPECPSEFSVGQIFGEYEYTVKMNSESVTSSGKSKVIAQERLTTDAGIFDCYKVECEVTFKDMRTTSIQKMIFWYAKNVGAVKTETYDKKGKLMSAIKLVSLKNN